MFCPSPSMFKVLALDIRSPASIPRVLQQCTLLLPLRHPVVIPGLRAARARKGNDRFAQFFLSQRRNPHREETSSHPTAERGRGLRSRPGKASSSQIPSKNPWRGKRARAQTNPRQNDAAGGGGGGRERQQPRKKKSHSGAGEESAAPNNAQQRHSERAGHNAVSEPTPVRREGKATRCSPCQRRVHTTRGSFARRRHTERSSEKGTTRWQGRRRRDILALRLLNANASHACLSVRRKVRTRRCASVAQSNPSSPVQQSE